MDKVAYAGLGAFVTAIVLGWFLLQSNAAANFCGGQLGLIRQMQQAQQIERREKK